MKNKKTGKVEHRSNSAVLSNTALKVSEAGRQRVLRERQKNVHAGVEGNLLQLNTEGYNTDSMTELTYNPYRFDSFVVKATGEPVKTASLIVLKDNRIFANL